jgi:hypothetical protein
MVAAPFPMAVDNRMSYGWIAALLTTEPTGWAEPGGTSDQVPAVSGLQELLLTRRAIESGWLPVERVQRGQRQFL